MKIFISNFLYRVGQWARDNQARLLRILFYILVGLAIIFLIAGGVARWQQWRYEKKVEALDAQLQKKDAESKAAQSRADTLKVEIKAKDVRIAELEKQSAAAKVVYERSKTEYVYLKDEYQQARDNPLSVDGVSCADLRAELGRLDLLGK